jgi:hypothetical protein
MPSFGVGFRRSLVITPLDQERAAQLNRIERLLVWRSTGERKRGLQLVTTFFLMRRTRHERQDRPHGQLQNELVSSAVSLRESVTRATAEGKTCAESDRISGRLADPKVFPPNPTANQPFSIADALLVHIPKDSKPGTYDILFGIELLSPEGYVVSKSVLAWPVGPQFAPDFGWSPALDVAGQSAGQYTIVSLLTLLPPEGRPIQLDAKSTTLTIAS